MRPVFSRICAMEDAQSICLIQIQIAILANHNGKCLLMNDSRARVYLTHFTMGFDPSYSCKGDFR